MTEDAREEGGGPEHAPRVVAVIVVGLRRLEERARNRAERAEAQHVLSAGRDGGRCGVVPGAEGRSELPERDRAEK
jgi:hypothetical protein